MAKIENGIIQEGVGKAQVIYDFFRVGKRADGKYHGIDLMHSGNIHPQSKIKPVDFNEDTIVQTATTVYGKYTRLNQDMWWRVNYGHNLPVYGTATEAISAVQAGTNCVYNKPANWKRFADFWGYNHNEQYWLRYSTNVANVTKGGNVTVTFEPLQNGSFEEIFQLKAAKDVNSNKDAWNVGFLMASSFSATQSTVRFLALTDSAVAGQQVSDVFDGSGKVTFNTGDMSVGSYKMYPVITTYRATKNSFNEVNDKVTGYQWLPYPFANTYDLNVVSSGGDTDVIGSISVVEPEYDLQCVDYNNYVFRMMMFGITVVNDSNAGYTVSVRWSINNINSGSEVNKPSGTSSEYVAAKSSEYIELFSAKEEDQAYRFSVGEMPPVVQVVYSITQDGRPQSSSESFELDKY